MAKKSFISLVSSDLQSPGSPYRTLIERTYGRLREDILSGQLTPGEKLLVEHLKDRYEVGAGTLREALSRLVSDAMVVAAGQRGFTVAPITPEELMDVTNVRVNIETQALRMSIQQGDNTWRNKLRSAYEKLSELEQPIVPAHARQWEMANAHFHDALLSACGSAWTLRIIHQLTQHCERYRRYAIGLQSGRDVHSEHDLIYQSAIEGKDARAALALEAHIRATPELIMRSIASGTDVFQRG